MCILVRGGEEKNSLRPTLVYSLVPRSFLYQHVLNQRPAAQMGVLTSTSLKTTKLYTRIDHASMSIQYVYLGDPMII